MEQDLENFVSLVREHEYFFDELYIKKRLNKLTKKLILNPFDKRIVKFIIKQIRSNKPLSVIRLGDGEMNILSFLEYPKLPILSEYAAKESVYCQKHSFKVDSTWLFLLKEMMLSSIKEANLIGVLGLWRVKEKALVDFISNIEKNPRGTWGMWTGLEYTLRLSKKGCFKDKNLTSAHLYFSVLKYIHLILKEVKEVYLITDQIDVMKLLSGKFPQNNFHIISTPISERPLTSTNPDFLYNTMKKIPQNMSQSLTLVGAGIWSEFYCTWIKRRGGVAIDIGSGFDLLLNKKVRPIHHNVNLNELN